MKTGLEVVKHTPYKGVLLVAYLVGAALVWLFRAYLFSLDSYGMFSPVLGAAVNFLIPLYAVGGLLAFLALLGTPWGSKAAKEGLQKVGLVNHAGEAPALIAKRQDRDNPQLTVWEFDPCGIPLGEWEDKRARIETALDITIAKMTWAEGRKLIRVYAVPAKSDFPTLLPWKEDYLPAENFGGSTGSGKSVLLKLLLMQSLLKGAEVYIADFKGGVDFPKVWHQKCRMCFTEEDLLYTLGQLVAVLEYRKGDKELAHCIVPAMPAAAGEVMEFLKKRFEDNGIQRRHYARVAVLVDEMFALFCRCCGSGDTVMVECGIAPDGQSATIRMSAPLGGRNPMECSDDAVTAASADFIRGQVDYLTFKAREEGDTLTAVCFLEGELPAQET